MRCRICRTARNLKYTPQQLRLQKDRNKNKLRLPLSAIPQTTGNICIDCDERLHNFHQLDDECDDVVDVDSNGFHENKTISVERPITVADGDDKRIMNVFYNKAAILQSNGPVETQTMYSLGSDGDAEVIELLTSRETTPDQMSNYTENRNEYSNAIAKLPTVIDVIDLEDYDETEKQYNEQSQNRKKPVNSVEKETRLLGCLNLVSSDSESEISFEPCPPLHDDIVLQNVKEKSAETKLTEKNYTTMSMLSKSVECTNNNNNLNWSNFSNVPIKHNLPVCEICGVSCLDKQSLQSHVRDEHEGYNCLLACKNHFATPLDLVNHMRQKHRSYDGEDLCEGARCSQDSAMTIRLRFMQRFTFYECQLCGLIQSQFKAHKTHIMQKHADESKSLRDPMMKTQLKCPSCHQNCGTQQVDICRHLISKHSSEEGSKYLTEVSDFQTIGLNKIFLGTLPQGTRFFKLSSHNKLFFECLLCQKILSNNRSITMHINGHNINDWKEFRAENTKLEDNNSSNAVEETKRKLKRKRLFKPDCSDPSENVSKREKLCKKPKIEYEIPLKTKKITLPKDIKITSEHTKTKKMTTQSASIPPNSVKNNIRTSPSEMKRHKKLKHKLDNKSSQNKKAQSCLSKVKVKPLLRHFPTQKYNCKHCQFMCKGFRKLQMHLLSSHRSEEYFSCDSCTRAFMNKTSLEAHRTQNDCKRRRRKCTHDAAENCIESKPKVNHNNNDNLDENSNKNNKTSLHGIRIADVKEIPPEQQSISSATSDSIWLKELLHLSHENKLKNIHNINTAAALKDHFDDGYFLRSEREQFNTFVDKFCCYCGKLFKNIAEFSEHENNHKAHKDMPWIHFSQTNKK